MSGYKYETPNWIDVYEREYDVNKESFLETYKGTEINILNATGTDANISIYFYNNVGQQYEDIRILNYKLPSNNMYFFRISDLVYKAHPNYAQRANFRQGWLKVISTTKLAVSGKITSGFKPPYASRFEDSWSIPFYESEIDFKSFTEQNNGHEWNDVPIRRKVPGPFPK